MNEKPIEEGIRSGRVAPDQDVEGHMPFRRSLEGAEDVEGHGIRVKVFVEDEDGEDDVEGHGVRIKI